MHMTVVASGTRGDVQPILALSQGLREAGHEVVIVAGSNFETWIRGHDFGFVPTIDMEALMGSEKGLAWSEIWWHSDVVRVWPSPVVPGIFGLFETSMVGIQRSSIWDDVLMIAIVT